MRTPTRLLALAIVGGLALTGVLPSLAATAPVVPGTACPVLPADNAWNMDISDLPVSANSARWMATTGAATTKLHPDFGPPKDYGIPFDVVTNAHATIPVKFLYADESDPGPYPFGSDIHVEGGSDRHAIMINRDTCTLYELYAARLKGSARVQAGAIEHALRFTVSCSARSYLWPARHQAGQTLNPDCPPMGARFRLKAGFDLTGFSPQARTILVAMQHYGVFLADNGSNWFFQGAVNAAWPASLIAELKTVPGSAFQVVDESACQVAPDSGRYAYGVGCPAP